MKIHIQFFQVSTTVVRKVKHLKNYINQVCILMYLILDVEVSPLFNVLEETFFGIVRQFEGQLNTLSESEHKS